MTWRKQLFTLMATAELGTVTARYQEHSPLPFTNDGERVTWRAAAFVKDGRPTVYLDPTRYDTVEDIIRGMLHEVGHLKFDIQPPQTERRHGVQTTAKIQKQTEQWTILQTEQTEHRAKNFAERNLKKWVKMAYLIGAQDHI